SPSPEQYPLDAEIPEGFRKKAGGGLRAAGDRREDPARDLVLRRALESLDHAAVPVDPAVHRVGGERARRVEDDVVEVLLLVLLERLADGVLHFESEADQDPAALPVAHLPEDVVRPDQPEREGAGLLLQLALESPG